MQARRWWMLGVTCLSVLAVALDLTVLNNALPEISAALHAGTGDLQWIVDAYSLAFAGVMLAAGLVGDRYGRKRLLLGGLAAAGSISQAAQLAARLGGRSGSALQAAAGTAYLHGMSIIMLTCAGVAALAAIASLRYLPGRAAPGDTPSLQAPATAASDTGARR